MLWTLSFLGEKDASSVYNRNERVNERMSECRNGVFKGFKYDRFLKQSKRKRILVDVIFIRIYMYASVESVAAEIPEGNSPIIIIFPKL